MTTGSNSNTTCTCCNNTFNSGIIGSSRLQGDTFYRCIGSNRTSVRHSKSITCLNIDQPCSGLHRTINSQRIPRCTIQFQITTRSKIIHCKETVIIISQINRTTHLPLDGWYRIDVARLCNVAGNLFISRANTHRSRTSATGSNRTNSRKIFTTGGCTVNSIRLVSVKHILTGNQKCYATNVTGSGSNRYPLTCTWRKAGCSKSQTGACRDFFTDNNFLTDSKRTKFQHGSRIGITPKLHSISPANKDVIACACCLGIT